MMVGPLKSTLEYALGSREDDARMPEVISGNVARFKGIRTRLGPAAKVRHFVISYAEEDRPSIADIVRDAEALLKHFCNRFDQPFSLDRLEWLSPATSKPATSGRVKTSHPDGVLRS